MVLRGMVVLMLFALLAGSPLLAATTVAGPGPSAPDHASLPAADDARFLGERAPLLGNLTDDTEETVDNVSESLNDTSDIIEDTGEVLDGGTDPATLNDTVSEEDDGTPVSGVTSAPVVDEMVADGCYADDDTLREIDPCAALAGQVDRSPADGGAGERTSLVEITVSAEEELPFQTNGEALAHHAIVAGTSTLASLGHLASGVVTESVERLVSDTVESLLMVLHSIHDTVTLVDLADESPTADSNEHTKGEADALTAMDTPDESGDLGLLSFGHPSILPALSIIAVATAVANLVGAGSLFSIVRTPVPRRIVRVGNLPRRFIGTLYRYSRYDDSDPLENEYRRAIFTSIAENPGLYLTQLETETAVDISTARHHLAILEEERLIKSQLHRGKRRFFPYDQEHVALFAALENTTTRELLAAIGTRGSATNGELAAALDRSPGTISHHLAGLEEDGLIRRNQRGRTVENSLVGSVSEVLDDRVVIERADIARGDGR